MKKLLVRAYKICLSSQDFLPGREPRNQGNAFYTFYHFGAYSCLRMSAFTLSLSQRMYTKVLSFPEAPGDDSSGMESRRCKWEVGLRKGLAWIMPALSGPRVAVIEVERANMQKASPDTGSLLLSAFLYNLSLCSVETQGDWNATEAGLNWVLGCIWTGSCAAVISSRLQRSKVR